MSYIHVGAKISTFMHLADASTQSDVRQKDMRKATKLLLYVCYNLNTLQCSSGLKGSVKVSSWRKRFFWRAIRGNTCLL